MDTIVKYLSDRLGAHTVILFGSDIAFIADREEQEDLSQHARELAALTGRNVGLISFNTAEPALKAQIVGRGKVIFDSRPYERAILFMRALKEYAFLNEERERITRVFGGRHHDQNGDIS